jgi:hypothetical protein
MRITTLLVVVVLLTTACGGSAAEIAASSPPPVRTPPLPSQFFDPSSSNTAIFSLDYQTLQLKTVYVSNQAPCSRTSGPLSDEELKRRTSGLFWATGNGWHRQIQQDANGQSHDEVAFTVTHINELAVLEIIPGDVGGFAVVDRCSGVVLYAGSIIYAGGGTQLYPAVPVPQEAIQRTADQGHPPQSLQVRSGPGAPEDTKGGQRAWESIRDVTLVEEIASTPYEVLVYLYPRTVGVFAAYNADWVIFVRRGPRQ